jgi:hypothetical protein
LIVYEATKSEFITDVFTDALVGRISRLFEEKIGKVNPGELRAWDNSMQYMYRVLVDHDIPADAGIAIEFKVPHTSKRIDFIITGVDENRNESVVVVELKQWEAVEKVEGREAVVKTVINRSLVELPHPSYQAWSYTTMIENYNETVQRENIRLYPCAYLHNYLISENDPLTDPSYAYYIEKAPVFAKGDAQKLRDFIKRHIKYGDKKEILYKIDRGKIRPSKSLQDALAGMLRGNPEFVMIDDQLVVFEEAIHLAKLAQRTGRKHVLIVEGGPGTGKSVLAIHLLVRLTQEGLVAQYVSKNAAPRNVYAAKLKGNTRKGVVDNLFKSSGSYVDAGRNEFDALIVDEAHRLNEKSGLFQNLGENQIKEIISAARFSVFFIDERQRVTLKDIGSIGLIKTFAAEEGADVTVRALSSQFRCDGSDGYMAWVDDVLQIRQTANADDLGVDYDIRIYSDPHEMKKEIIRLNAGRNKSRIVAGYCWDWDPGRRNDPNHHDIVIPEHQFGMSWNLGNTSTWAIDEHSVEQAGCIHTCQGLEFDYVGVIIGDDLVYRDGSVMTDYTKRAKTDQSLRGLNKLLRDNPEEAFRTADAIIRNTYRTLLTRGLRGCFIYCTDKPLEHYLRERIRRATRRVDGK